MDDGSRKMRLFAPRVASPRAAALLVAGLLSIASPSFAIAPAKLSGALTGLVRNGVGIPQMGANVLLFTHEDRLFARALTDEKGAFSFLSLAPDIYSVRVSLRSFVPVFRDGSFSIWSASTSELALSWSSYLGTSRTIS